jgi:hypothetical protein
MSERPYELVQTPAGTVARLPPRFTRSLCTVLEDVRRLLL